MVYLSQQRDLRFLLFIGRRLKIIQAQTSLGILFFKTVCARKIDKTFLSLSEQGVMSSEAQFCWIALRQMQT